MNTGDMTVADVSSLFISGLMELYDKNEINSILYILFDDFLGWTRTRIHLEPGAVLPVGGSEKFTRAFLKMKEGCPVQYITGKAGFNDLQVAVDPSVLIPRPETAELALIIERDLKTIDPKGFSILDIGTGSGCIAIYLKKHFPSINMHASDISETALSLARSNAGFHKTEIDFILSDILNPRKDIFSFSPDVIVSNPPYVTFSEKSSMPVHVKDFEPYTALFVTDEDPLVYYRAIADFAVSCLSAGGLLYLEINERFGTELKELLRTKGFTHTELIKDFLGRDRFIRAGFRTRS